MHGDCRTMYDALNVVQLQRFNFRAWDTLPAPEKVDINLNLYYDLSGFLCYTRYGKEYIWSRATKEWVRVHGQESGKGASQAS